MNLNLKDKKRRTFPIRSKEEFNDYYNTFQKYNALSEEQKFAYWYVVKETYLAIAEKEDRLEFQAMFELAKEAYLQYKSEQDK